MAILYEVEHVTTYRYAAPVTFGAHRAMFLPRSEPYGRILSYSATTISRRERAGSSMPCPTSSR